MGVLVEGRGSEEIFTPPPPLSSNFGIPIFIILSLATNYYQVYPLPLPTHISKWNSPNVTSECRLINLNNVIIYY